MLCRRQRQGPVPAGGSKAEPERALAMTPGRRPRLAHLPPLPSAVVSHLVFIKDGDVQLTTTWLMSRKLLRDDH